jgi:hypothetical protein
LNEENDIEINITGEKLSPDAQSYRMSKDSDEDTIYLNNGASMGMELFYGFLENITSRKPKNKLRDSIHDDDSEESVTTEVN